MHRQATTRRLNSEKLEARTLMAGDLSVNVREGILFVRGDAADNGVLIRNAVSGDSSKLEIVGVATTSGATTVGGESSATVEGVTGGVVVQLGNGDDLVQLGDAAGRVALPAGVLIATGNGDDDISGRFASPGLVTMALGAGSDSVNVRGSSAGALVINADPVLIPSGQTAGDDDVTLIGVRTRLAAAIRTGDGHDTVEVSGPSAFNNGLAIVTGAGDDRVKVEGSEQTSVAVGRALAIYTADGNDSVEVEHTTVTGVATIATGGGSDNVTLEYLRAADGLFAYLGGGDDSLSVRNSASRRAALLGGLGDDTFVGEDNSFDWVTTGGFN